VPTRHSSRTGCDSPDKTCSQDATIRFHTRQNEGHRGINLHARENIAFGLGHELIQKWIGRGAPIPISGSGHTGTNSRTTARGCQPHSDPAHVRRRNARLRTEGGRTRRGAKALRPSAGSASTLSPVIRARLSCILFPIQDPLSSTPQAGRPASLPLPATASSRRPPS
jgi:hypothetical protein